MTFEETPPKRSRFTRAIDSTKGKLAILLTASVSAATFFTIDNAAVQATFALALYLLGLLSAYKLAVTALNHDTEPKYYPIGKNFLLYGLTGAIAWGSALSTNLVMGQPFGDPSGADTTIVFDTKCGEKTKCAE